MTAIHSFEIRYETAPDVPPPYCCYYHLQGKLHNDQLHVDFQWVHHHREELTEEEIMDEGFTGRDDFAWQGEINKVWLDEFEKLLRQTRRNEKPADSAAYLEIRANSLQATVFAGTPLNATEWEYVGQELIQGIYETAGKEAPLVIRFKKVFPDKTDLFVSLTFLFSRRIIQGLLKQRTENKPFLADWEAVKPALSQLYALDYEPETAISREPTQPGLFVDPGEGAWYELGNETHNPSSQRKTEEAVVRFFLSFR